MDGNRIPLIGTNPLILEIKWDRDQAPSGLNVVSYRFRLYKGNLNTMVYTFTPTKVPIRVLVTFIEM
jgi:hypothetical protein